MSFNVATAGTGVVGWQYLKATEERQTEAFSQSPATLRDTDHFREKIKNVSSVDEFVSDTQLMRVSLGAFGLEDDIGNRAFIRKIITDGTEDQSALANKLADKTYLEFAKVFEPERLSGAKPFDLEEIDKIISDFQTSQFEIAVGNADEDLRIALNLERELKEIASSDNSEETMYYRILGDPPLRLAFETAFGLPTGFSSIDIDQQVEVLQDSVSNRFGSTSVEQFNDPEKMEDLVHLYLMRASIEEMNIQSLSAQTALALLTST